MEKYVILIIALLHFGKANNNNTVLYEISERLKDLTDHLKNSSFDNCFVVVAENLGNLLGNLTVNSAACKAKHPNLRAQMHLNHLIRDILSQSQGSTACEMKFGQCSESLEMVALLHGYTKFFTDWNKALYNK